MIVKERPILFSAPMVRAILEGRKTVTRRAIKIQPHIDASGNFCVGSSNYGQDVYGKPVTKHFVNGCCPYGKPGERLWVRETFALLGNEDGVGIDWADNLVKGDEREAARIYRASCHVGDYGLWMVPAKADWKPDTEEIHYEGAWRPSIHMPRWASRILLEITAVRVERLQDITQPQAQAEGCFFTDYGRKCGHTGSGCTEVGACPAPEAHHPQQPGWMWDQTTNHEQCLDSARHAFGNLWESVGGSWDANPWVWVVEFKRVAS